MGETSAAERATTAAKGGCIERIPNAQQQPQQFSPTKITEAATQASTKYLNAKNREQGSTTKVAEAATQGPAASAIDEKLVKDLTEGNATPTLAEIYRMDVGAAETEETDESATELTEELEFLEFLKQQLSTTKARTETIASKKLVSETEVAIEKLATIRA